MEPQTVDLQGIKASASQELKDLRQKNLTLRELAGLQHGQPVKIEGQESILESFHRDELEAAQYLADYLSGQEDGGGRTFDEVFQDARSFEDLARQTSLVAQLMAELDGLAGSDRDFEGRAEARRMLANLSLRLKKTARVAATRPGRLTTW